MTAIIQPGSEIGSPDFIERYGLWTDEQKAAAKEVSARAKAEGLRGVRVCATDAHGKLRGKTILAGLFDSVLRNGMDFTVAIYYLDTADTFVFNAFSADGGLGNERFQGFPDLVLVPDPTTFTVLPYADKTGWCLGNFYYSDGTPLAFDGRYQLQRALTKLETNHGLRLNFGLEIEFYLTKLVEEELTMDKVGYLGQPPEPPQVRPLALDYEYQSEDHMDQIDPILAKLADNLLAVGLPLRTMEIEAGCGQFEFTFSPIVGIKAADSMMLFKTIIRQVARRMGLHTTFMCRPIFKNFSNSGWHLHQSLLDAEGNNIFATPAGSDQPVSELGKQYIAGLLEHSSAASVLTTPTVNGYRRRKSFSLAPDRATWGVDNRAAMLRLQGGPGDVSTHIENRIGEPAANPYLYFASQALAGMDGFERALDPGEPEADPYTATHRPLLPVTLAEALPLFQSSELYRREFGNEFVDWLVGLKTSELDRFNKAEGGWNPNAVSEWEHREYFRTF